MHPGIVFRAHHQGHHIAVGNYSQELTGLRVNNLGKDEQYS
jgi:hypothetical protein